MRLTDLHPQFLNTGGPGVERTNAAGEYEPAPLQVGVGVLFDCPCGCDCPCYVPFAVALDGSDAREEGQGWQRTGDTFETLTLKPSILRIVSRGGCGWHGWITDGEVTTC